MTELSKNESYKRNNMKQGSLTTYSYNKAIRFKLEHLTGELPNIPDGQTDLNDLVDKGESLANAFEKFIYINNSKGDFDTKDGRKILTKYISVKKQWLKMHFKNDFYASSRQQKDFPISGIEYIKAPLDDWFINFRKQLSCLREISTYADHEKSRKSEIAYILSVINNKSYFVLVRDFCEYANHKYDQSEQNKLRNLVTQFEQQLTDCINKYLPSQSAGLIVAQGSMNYYTVNKKTKGYKEQLCNLRERLEDLEQKYTERKENKARQKSRLYELIKSFATEETIKKECPLFADDVSAKSMEGVIKLTLEIQELNKQKDGNNNLSQDTREQISQLKQQRGHYFIKKTRGKGHDYYFKKYWGYCQEYKKIATDRGKVIAKIKGIEREKIESENLKYWALIFATGCEKHLWLIPKGNMQEFKNNINNPAKGDCDLHIPHSLTMRALHKLCFAEESSFVEDMPTELKQLQGNAKKATNDKSNKNYSQAQSKDVLTLRFLKKLIKSDYAHKILDLEYYNLDKLQDAKDLDEFETLLETACYYMEKIEISESFAKDCIENCNILIFKITSYDLEERNKNTYQTAETKSKRHTSQIWEAFWQGKSQIRLNPEVKIRYRQKNEELTSYMKQRGFDLSKVKNRFLEDQYTLGLTFTLNAGKKYPQLAFAKTEELCQKINEFNEKFNKQNWQGSYRYGIDRGDKELSTLCIAKFDENKNPSFPDGTDDTKTYELRSEWYDKKMKSDMESIPYDNRKEKRVIANISYFIDKAQDPDWFNKNSCTCIDLTTAKVIKDKIVLNGDVLTFLKLKKEAAKRILFELVSNGKITAENKKLKWDDESPDELRIKPYKEEDTIYFFEGQHGRNFNGLLVKDDIAYTRDNIKNNLQAYLDNLLDEKAKQSSNPYKHVPTVNKINHLRDALVANMVGVICHLQDRYPGYIVLEDLGKKLVAGHFEKYYINISRPLERALVSRFQTMGMVPPHIKDIIEIRESSRKKNKMKSSQLGAIVFVDESGTSKQCPYCGKSWKWESEDNLKFKEHRYICGETNPCGFDTNQIEGKFAFLKEINDPDKVAAYNIARKIDDYDKIAILKSSDGTTL